MKTKLLIPFLLFLSVTAISVAQRGDDDDFQDHKQRLEECIPDLKACQKTQLDIITRRAESNIKTYRAQLNAVRDSIRMLMDKEGDQRLQLYPLFTREGNIAADISKEYYQLKLNVDNLLTHEQLKVLKQRIEESRKPHPQKKHSDKSR